MSDPKQDEAVEVWLVSEMIGKEWLAGRGPDTQSAILSDLVARYLAGFPDVLRPEMMRILVELVWQLVPVNEKLQFGETGHPQNQGETR